MSGIPTFSPEENITRVQMEKDVLFVVVEGTGDTPIYESVINSMLPLETRELRDVVHVGGKSNIKTLVAECGGSNYICIADKDFDDPINSSKVVNLSRYSIENFLICEEAISAALAISLKASFNHVFNEFDLTGFLSEVEEKGKKLLQALFYYHREVSPQYGTEKVAWSTHRIHKNPPDWGLCDEKIENLVDALIPDQVTTEYVEQYYHENFNQKGAVAHDLPGKMLKVLLQQYVGKFYRKHKAKGGNQFRTPPLFVDAIVSCLNHSAVFTNEIGPIIDFLTSDEQAVAI